MKLARKPTFRSLEKEGIEFQLPVQLARLLRRRANGYRSISVVGTEVIARGLGLDPGDFGVEPAAARDQSG